MMDTPPLLIMQQADSCGPQPDACDLIMFCMNIVNIIIKIDIIMYCYYNNNNYT